MERFGPRTASPLSSAVLALLTVHREEGNLTLTGLESGRKSDHQ